MARIAGVDIPREKRVEVALTYVFGIGRTTAQKVLDETGISRDTRVRNLTEDEVVRIRAYVDQHLDLADAVLHGPTGTLLGGHLGREGRGLA